MTALNLIELQTGLDHFHTRLGETSLTAHEHVGFELGWDYAHYRVSPPAPYAQEPSPLRNGLLAGQAAFGLRTLSPTRHVRKWLQLRLHAWLRGRSVELVQVTPNYLQQIDVNHCPITRVALSSALMAASDASVDRVRNDAGYAAGNLAVMSTAANSAKAACGFRDAMRIVRELEASRCNAAGGLAAAKTQAAGLSAGQWARVAVLCSFVEPLDHLEASALPMLVFPPNRLRLFNPVQALQAFVSRQLLTPGWSRRIARFEELLAAKPVRRAFQMFFHALLPRVLEVGRTDEPHRARCAVEDAWRNPLVMKRWTTFARLLTAAQCEDLLSRAAAKKLSTQRIERIDSARATEGWQLESRGYVPHAVLMRRSPARRAPGQGVQANLPL